MIMQDWVDKINERLVPVSKIKDVLGVSDRMVWVYINQGIPHYKVCGRVMFSVKEVEKWMRERQA